jgi:maltose alpha-D-glucosyltransferase/alpha-amylase
MARSFNYAAWATIFSLEDAQGEARVDLAALAAEWEGEALGAFMAGYGQGIAGCPSVPHEAEALEGLLSLFTLEKALYEVSQEAAHRPNWLRIPIRGVARVVGWNLDDMVKDAETAP